MDVRYLAVRAIGGWLWSICVGALVAGCSFGGRLDTSDEPSTAPHFHPGESMSFSVGIGPLSVGEAGLAVGEVGLAEGLPTVRVDSRIGSTGVSSLVTTVDDHSSSVVRLDTGEPQTTHTTAQYGSSRFTSEAVFDPSGESVRVQFARPSQRPIVSKIVAPDGARLHDMHTAMAALRPWMGTEGESRDLWVLGGRRLWKSSVIWKGRERIETAVGTREAIRIEGIAERYRGLEPDPRSARRRFTVWLSDDADRVPLRVRALTEIADVDIELTAYARR